MLLRAEIGAPERLGLRAQRAESGGQPCGLTALCSSVWGRAVYFAPSAARTAHGSRESVGYARTACAPPPALRCAPPPTARRTRSPSRSPVTTVACGSCPGTAVSQRRGRAGCGARGGRRPGAVRGAACPQGTLRELTRGIRAQSAQRTEQSRPRAPRAVTGRAVGLQGRPPASRAAACSPAALSRHHPQDLYRTTATGRQRTPLRTQRTSTQVRRPEARRQQMP